MSPNRARETSTWTGAAPTASSRHRRRGHAPWRNAWTSHGRGRGRHRGRGHGRGRVRVHARVRGLGRDPAAKHRATSRSISTWHSAPSQRVLGVRSRPRRSLTWERRPAQQLPKRQGPWPEPRAALPRRQEAESPAPQRAQVPARARARARSRTRAAILHSAAARDRRQSHVRGGRRRSVSWRASVHNVRSGT